MILDIIYDTMDASFFESVQRTVSLGAVIPAKAGIYVPSKVKVEKEIDSRLRGNDIVFRGNHSSLNTPLFLKVSMHITAFSPGDTLRLVGFGGTPPGYKSRLLSLGLTKGTELRLIRKAPLGCPIQVEVRGTSLTLRLEEAGELIWEAV